ncbi:MAG: 3-isopropylmalate dehydrogenase [Anaerolineales bacterium]|nr:3-isopropylmalate dehydrogenase [Anaerolineales bacterium]
MTDNTSPHPNAAGAPARRIVLLPGDGIGPEVTAAAAAVLEAAGRGAGLRFAFETHLAGGCSIDRYGSALTDEALDACLRAEAVFLGAVGGPQWDDPLAEVRPEQGLLRLRKALGVFANLRPVRLHPALLDASPLRPERLHGVDLLVVRELTGGLYFGEPKGRRTVDGRRAAVDTMSYVDYEVRRVVELAFRLAQTRRGKLASVDKANVLETSRLWRQVALETAADFPDVELEHVLVDTAAMRLVNHPAAFDVLVTENTFGDILTDEASVLCGSMGLLPSASLGEGGPGLYEPIHGSAPDIAGQGIANPIGAILSAALLLRHSLAQEDAARRVEEAVWGALAAGARTRDLGGAFSTDAMTAAVLERLE